MPDCICDVKTLRRTEDKNRKIVRKARAKLKQAAFLLQAGKPPKEGLSVWSWVAGLLGQRLWFYGKTRSYTDRLKIDQKACCGCGLCAKLCPMDNLSLVQGKAQAGDWCTMCYRCINRCPERAITLLGRKVLGQERVEDYLRSRK